MSALPDQLPRPRSSQAGTPARENRGRTLNYFSGGSQSSPLLRVGGGLSLAGVLLGITFFLLGCAGFNGAFYFSPAAVIFGAAGGLLTFISTCQPIDTRENGPVTGSLMIAFIAILGGLLELAVCAH